MSNKKNLSPSKLKHMRMLIESNSELSDGQKEMFLRLIDSQLAADKSPFEEFHSWIKKGDVILTNMLSEMNGLRQLTSPDADLISKAAVLQLLSNFRIDQPKNDADNSINWVLGKLQEKVEALNAKEGV